MTTPTAADTRFRNMAGRMISKSGRTVVLRRVTRVADPDKGTSLESPISDPSLTLSGAVLAGATTLSLAKAGVVGLLVAGDTLGLAGAAYTVTGGPYASNAGDDGFSGVTFAPALAADAADGAPVAVTFTGTDHALKAAITAAEFRYVDGTIVQSGDSQLLMSKLSLESAGVDPVPGDDLFLGSDVATARSAEIVKVTPIASGELDCAVYLFARAR